MNSIKIEDLYQQLEGVLSQNFAGMLVESCVFCLESETHTSGIELIPYAHKKNNLRSSKRLEWTTTITPPLKSTLKDANRATDNAAMCLSLLLTPQLTGFTHFESSQKGDGIDFWLSRADELEFTARLEISGIRQSTADNSVKKRLKMKLSQVKQSDSSQLPAFVSIVEFSKPEMLYIQK
jgi:hypothetical protein